MGACAQKSCLMEGMTLAGQPFAHGSGAGNPEVVPCLRCCLQQHSVMSLRTESARGLSLQVRLGQ